MGIFLFIIVFFLFYFIIIYLGSFCNFNHSSYGIFYPYYSHSGTLHTVSNCTFYNINGSSSCSVPFHFPYSECPFTVVNCTFYNLRSTVSSNYGIAVHFPLSSSYSYTFSGNTLYNISGARHVVSFTSSFSSFSFANNSFQNISSSSYGGVFYFYFFSILWKGVCLFTSKSFSFSKICFVNCSGPKGLNLCLLFICL
jgi:hypothetical protein